jgi:hypothetical protein
MAGVWEIGNHVKVQGMNSDLKYCLMPSFLVAA